MYAPTTIHRLLLPSRTALQVLPITFFLLVPGLALQTQTCSASSMAVSDAAMKALSQGQPNNKPVGGINAGTDAPAGKAMSVKLQDAADAALKMYTVRTASELDNIVKTYYTDNCRFIDPIANAVSAKDVRLQFFSLQKLFTEVTVNKQTPTVQGQADGMTQVLVPNHQHYVFKRDGWLAKRLAPEQVDLQTNTALTIEDATGKIVIHSDTWEGKPVPPTFLRSMNAAVSNALLRMMGWERQLKMNASSGN